VVVGERLDHEGAKMTKVLDHEGAKMTKNAKREGHEARRGSTAAGVFAAFALRALRDPS